MEDHGLKKQNCKYVKNKAVQIVQTHFQVCVHTFTAVNIGGWTNDFDQIKGWRENCSL